MAERDSTDYEDAAIVAGAERLPGSVLVTEHLNHGQTYASVRVVNPFLPT